MERKGEPGVSHGDRFRDMAAGEHPPEQSEVVVEMTALKEAMTLAIEDKLSLNQREVAEAAAGVFNDLRQRAFHGKQEEAARITERVLDNLGLDAGDYTSAKMLALIPADQLSHELYKVQSHALNAIVAAVDSQLAEQFTDSAFRRTRGAHWRSIVYDVAQLEHEHKPNREGATDDLTGIVRDESYLKKLYEIELKYLELLPSMRGMLVVKLDIDNFKRVNDTLGHEPANDILKEFAQNLDGAFNRRLDTLGQLRGTAGRPGGDEFVYFLNDVNFQASATEEDDPVVPSPQKMNATIEKLLSRIQAAANAVELPNEMGNLSVSIGVARLHSEDANGGNARRVGDEGQMLPQDKPRHTPPTFEEMMKRSDGAAMWAKKHDDGMAAEWAPNLPEVQMTLGRLKRGLVKDFERRNPKLNLQDFPALDAAMNDHAVQLAIAYGVEADTINPDDIIASMSSREMPTERTSFKAVTDEPDTDAT